MLLILIFLPFINFLILLISGRFLGNKGLSFMISFTYFLLVGTITKLLISQLSKVNIYYFKLYNWIYCMDYSLHFEFLFDNLTIFMLLLIIIISTIVNLYSIDYMRQDPHKIRFFSYLSLFCFFMILLVTSSNLVLLLFGWEGVGICSYLLIGFWFQRNMASKASIKAIILNRIGDCGLLIAISILFFITKNFNFQLLFCILPFITFDNSFFFINFVTLDFILFFIFLGAMGKSAQLFLHVWLADAMEGPTPVSALIHAATMVTAGVYLLIRFSFLLEYVFTLNKVILFIGIVTTLFASTAGLVQNDLKKIIAYSTCSQLGYMIAACGISGYSFSIFHLINHGFFKALLFLSAGLIIHGMLEEQDIRKMGGLYYTYPLTYIYFIIGSFCLLGFPYLTGFFSKDFLFEFYYTFPSFLGNFVYHLGTFSAILTGIYSFRLLILVFLMKPNNFRQKYKKSVGDHWTLSYKMLSILACISIFVGYIFSEVFLGLGSSFLLYSIFFKSHILQDTLLYKTNTINIDYWIAWNASIKLLPLCYTLLGFFFSIYIYFLLNQFNYFFYSKYYRFIFIFFYQGWFFNYIFLLISKTFFFRQSLFFFKLEKGFFENSMPEGVKIKFYNFTFVIIVLSKYWNTLDLYFIYLIYLCSNFCLFFLLRF